MIRFTASDLLAVNLAWYVLLTLWFAYEGNTPKALYFCGAFILTVGIYLAP